jgi:hypothetical protein
MTDTTAGGRRIHVEARNNWITTAVTLLPPGWVNIFAADDGKLVAHPAPALLRQQATSVTENWWSETTPACSPRTPRPTSSSGSPGWSSPPSKVTRCGQPPTCTAATQQRTEGEPTERITAYIKPEIDDPDRQQARRINAAFDHALDGQLDRELGVFGELADLPTYIKPY